MTVDSRLSSIKTNFRRHGGQAMKIARKSILQNYRDNNLICEALRYFSKATLSKALPVFPALISMSCEAVGGKKKCTIPFGEAIVFITGAADLHDDLIDASVLKRGKQTVLGKFGSTTTILAGDVLLAEGISRLHEAGDYISKEKSARMVRLVADAVYEICQAEALESQLRRNQNLSPKEYQEIIFLKSVVPSIAMRIGAILGNGDQRSVEMLGNFGRSYGIISATLEEFADLFELDELQNRLKNECPPLPLICALQNLEVRKSLTPLLNCQVIKRSTHNKIIDVSLASEEVAALQKATILKGKEAVDKIACINREIRKELENALFVPLMYFE